VNTSREAGQRSASPRYDDAAWPFWGAGERRHTSTVPEICHPQDGRRASLVCVAVSRDVEDTVTTTTVETAQANQAPYGGTKDSGVRRDGARYAMKDLAYERMLVLTGVTL
jgi:hypothetical protein